MILVVAVTVLSAWTFRLEMDTIYRGADASNMIEEFQAYGLNQTTMINIKLETTVCHRMMVVACPTTEQRRPLQLLLDLSTILTDLHVGLVRLLRPIPRSHYFQANLIGMSY